MVRGSPCICMRMAPARAAATVPGEASSKESALTSLTTTAPASSAADMTAARRVSIETRMPSPASARITGNTRPHSSDAVTGAAPGRVDSPPISTMSAPASVSLRPASIASPTLKLSPPSEKLSGVALTTPISRARSSVSPANGGRGRAIRSKRSAIARRTASSSPAVQSSISARGAAVARTSFRPLASITTPAENATGPPASGLARPVSIARAAASPISSPLGSNAAPPAASPGKEKPRGRPGLHSTVKGRGVEACAVTIRAGAPAPSRGRARRPRHGLWRHRSSARSTGGPPRPDIPLPRGAPPIRLPGPTEPLRRSASRTRAAPRRPRQAPRGCPSGPGGQSPRARSISVRISSSMIRAVASETFLRWVTEWPRKTSSSLSE